MEKERNRKFCMLLYPLEDETHARAIEYIKTTYDYAIITHDKDKDEEGRLKKSHTHVVISLNNAKWNTALAEEIGLPLNYIQKCRSFSNALEYLIHYNDDSKEQYDIECVSGTLKKRLVQLINTDAKSEGDIMMEVVEFIHNTASEIDMYVFYKWLNANGYWSEYRRNSHHIGKYIDKHDYAINKTGEVK